METIGGTFVDEERSLITKDNRPGNQQDVVLWEEIFESCHGLILCTKLGQSMAYTVHVATMDIDVV